MVELRSGKDRRVNKDERKGGISSYNGPENRGSKQQRINKDRRDIKNNSLMKKALSFGNEDRRSGIDQREFFTLALCLKEGQAKIEEVSLKTYKMKYKLK
ncbi:MAG: hypothetical protein KJO26_16705 [Deltaproteobacteria bacterium]|nr:hypothetical protein [Deltaproteobacteria bacterium]